jgi:hypothetical protein
MVGLTRFCYLMNLCEKIATPANICSHFPHFKKGAFFRWPQKHFVLQTSPDFSPPNSTRRMKIVMGHCAGQFRSAVGAKSL